MLPILAQVAFFSYSTGRFSHCAVAVTTRPRRDNFIQSPVRQRVIVPTASSGKVNQSVAFVRLSVCRFVSLRLSNRLTVKIESVYMCGYHDRSSPEIES